MLAFQGSWTAASGLAISIPIAVVTIPILDAALAFARRRLSGRPFDKADRGHIHHRLLARGLTKWQTLGVIGTLCVASGTAAASAAVLASDVLAWLAIGSIVLLLAATRAFGHYELALLRMAVAHAGARCWRRLVGPRWGQASVPARPARRDLTFAQAWDRLVADVKRWHGRRLELRVTAAGREPVCERLWVDRTEASLSAIDWSFTMSFAGTDGQVRHLHVAGTDAGVAQQWALGQLMGALRAFGENWLAAAAGDHLANMPLATRPAAWSARLPDPRLPRTGREAA
jgi:UDP-GlcNAc:undecaprenyl-phosphate GlcNAc-1-phosphate transferase